MPAGSAVGLPPTSPAASPATASGLLYSTATGPSACPCSGPGVAVRSSPGLVTSPACSDGSTTAAGPVPAATVSRSAENHPSAADPECGLRRDGPSSVCAPAWPGSWPRRRPKLHDPSPSACPQTNGCCPSTPAPPAPARSVCYRTAWLLRMRASAFFPLFLQVPYPANKSVANLDGNHNLQ